MPIHIKKWARGSSATLLVSVLACEQDQPRLPTPEVVATSRYIEYSTWAEPAPLCMESRLAAADGFIEKTAVFLEIEPPPAGSIRYIYVPQSLWDRTETWGCSASAGGCFFAEGRFLEDRSVIYSWQAPSWHELVHAVGHALGLENWVLREGLADYISQVGTTGPILATFPETLKDDLERGKPSLDYRAATHFVGTLIERHGVARFKRFGARIDSDDRWDGVASAYAQEFGQDLEEALEEMALAPISTRGVFECEGEAIPWTNAGELDVTLTAVCGDPQYYSPGTAPETPGAFKTYVLDVPDDAMYELSLTGKNGGTVSGLIQNCERRALGWTVFEEPRTAPLEPGKHVLSVGFPSADGVLGDLDLRLTRLDP